MSTFLCYACGDPCKGYSGFEIEIRHIEPDEDDADQLRDYRHLLCGDCASFIIDFLDPGPEERGS